MQSQAEHQDLELREILEKIEVTLKLRSLTLVSFFLIVSIIGLLKLFPYSHYIWLTIGSIAFWIFTAAVFRILVNKLKNVSEISNLYFIYSAIFELGFLTILVFANGSIMWIGVVFYLFTIIYSNIVLPKTKGHWVSIFACFWIGGLVSLQYFQIIPFIPFAEFRDVLYLDFKYVVSTLSLIFPTFILAGLAANVLTDLLKKKNEELEKLKSELEIAKAVLEVKVRARTRELEEIANGLDVQVQERTKDLEDKIKDLRRFQSLAVDRELKMVELKEEIKKIKDGKINLSA